MADVYRDLCSDGTVADSIVGGGDPAVYFGTIRVKLPAEGNCIRAVGSGFTTGLAIVGGQNDIAYLVRDVGTVAALGPCYGRQSVAITVDDSGQFHTAVVRDAFSFMLDGSVRPLPPEQRGTSIGIADINPDGSVQWMAEPDPNRPGEMRPREITVGDVRLRYYVERNGVYLGQLLNGAEDQVVLWDGEAHTLYRGLGHEPHLTVMGDGRLGACWRELGQGAGALIGPPWPPFHDASQDLPPVESVPLLNRPFGVAVYCFNDVRTVGNIELPIRPSWVPQDDAPILATTDDESDVDTDDLWAIYSGESKDLPAEQAIQQARVVGDRRRRGLSIYQDSTPMRETVMSAREKDDLLAPQCYRNAGEFLPLYSDRVALEYTRVSGSGECWPTINIHQRYKTNPDGTSSPTLSVREVVEGFVTACQLAQAQRWPGMHLFRIGTTDCPLDALLPYLDRFMSGITGTPPARVIPEPEEPVSIKTAVSHLITNFRFGDFDQGIETRPAWAQGSDETVEVIKNSDGTYSVKNNNGTEWLSVQQDGSIQSRPTSDPTQPRTWEKFDRKGNSLIERSKDGHGGTIPPGRSPVTLLVAGSL